MPNFFQKLFPGFYPGVVMPLSDYKKDIIPQIINGKLYTDKNFESISTLYTCVKVISETISRLPLNVYQETDAGRIADKKDYRYPILHLTPNNYTNSQAFIGALEYIRNIKGNAFARINRLKNTGTILNFTIIPNDLVIGYNILNGQLYYRLLKEDRETEYTLPASDILHFRGVSSNGIWGFSPIAALRLNLSTTLKGMNTIDSFYENNAVTPKALKSTIPDEHHRGKQLKENDEFAKEYNGPTNAGKIMLLPNWTEIQDLSLSMVDAEFISTLKYNAGQIASVYGVPTPLVGLFDATKFSSVSEMMLSFKTNTLSAIMKMYRMEFEMKLLSTKERLTGKTIEFNTMSLIETDEVTRIASLDKMMKMGVLSPNQIAIIEGHPTYPEGDKHFIASNITAIEDRVPLKSKE